MPSLKKFGEIVVRIHECKYSEAIGGRGQAFFCTAPAELIAYLQQEEQLPPLHLSQELQLVLQQLLQEPSAA